MSILSADQLTGRVRTHVLDLPDSGCILHPDAATAFLALRAAAVQSDIDLAPVSSFRTFQHQLTIWNDKFHGRRPLLDQDGRALDPAVMSEEQIVRAILLWSALPGASRHHWGTEIDLIDRHTLPQGQRPQLIPIEYAAGGVFERLGAWLPRHCQDYGFFLPYDRDRGGVRPEPWHLSFAPVSSTALPALTVDVLAAALGDVELGGAAVVRRQLADIHLRYVCAVAQPGTAALAASRLSPAARPS
ncbi:MAG TPA: M15 family metallopeptidase [Steroidobacteraceae bacterium]|nr:M15 family metallopeptidase [Steroidobacteraceae bacterium]